MTGATIKTRLMLALASRVGASQMEYSDAPKYIETGCLADLTAVAGKYKSLFPKSCRDTCTRQGRVYAIPWDFGSCAVFYKRNIFARYGIGPGSINTWDDYIRAGQTILQKSNCQTKMLPLSGNDLALMFQMLLQETHGEILDDQGRIAIDSPQAQATSDVIKRLRQSGVCADVAGYSPQ